MSLGPEKIILILVVALIVFGPQRLPDIARQVGAAMRELRQMQDTVRDELEHVLHPDYSPANPSRRRPHRSRTPTTPRCRRAHVAERHRERRLAEDVTDDGFAGPRSFS